MFLEQHGEPFVNEKKFVENVYFCMPPLPSYNRANQLEQEKFKTCMLHVCMSQLHRQFTFVVFLCGKGN